MKSRIAHSIFLASSRQSTARSSGRPVNLVPYLRSRKLSSWPLATAAQAATRKTIASVSKVDEKKVSWTRSFRSSCRCLAEEVPTYMPFESNILNLLSNNEEFKELVTKFAERMQVLLGIDVNDGQMPSMSDMMRCSQDPELQDMSVKLTKILQDDGINLSPDTLKYIWENMQGRGK